MKRHTSLLLLAALAAFTGLLVIALLNGVVRARPVVVAAAPLNPGTRLTAELVEVREIPGGAVLDGAIESLEEVVGQTLTVGRAAGDQITVDVVGAGAEAGIPAALAPDHVAVAIRVNQASGLAGALRPGQSVSVVAVVDPAQLLAHNLTASYVPPLSPSGYLPPEPTSTPEPLPDSPVARMAISGLRVLLVPQSFRYEEAVAGEDELFTSARTTLAAQQGSVVVLDVPIAPRELAPGLVASPAVVLALLDNLATLHLVLEPTGGLVAGDAPATLFENLYYALTGFETPDSVTAGGATRTATTSSPGAAGSPALGEVP